MTLPYFIACMSVYLVISRLVLEARLVEESLNLIPVEIGDADGFDQTGIDQLLQPLKHKTFHFNFFPPRLSMILFYLCALRSSAGLWTGCSTFVA